MTNKKIPAKAKTLKKEKTVSQKVSRSKKNQLAGEGTENRKSHRIPIQLLVDYRSEGHYLFDFCRDLGTGGVFIQTKDPLPHGSSVELTFTIPDSKETLDARGQVIWVQDHISSNKELIPGMGVQFSDFDSKQRKILEDFVERYHSQSIKKPA